MAKRHKEVAKKLRAFWKHELGGKCEMAYTGKCRGQLTFDCIIPQGDAHHKGSTDQRMAFYVKQIRLNNIQLLCEKHNAQKKAREMGLFVRERRNEDKEDNNPF